jgi:hypothetical protein
MTRIDHKVQFRSYETLLAISMRQRELASMDHLCVIKARKLVERYIGQTFEDVGRLSLELFHHDQDPFVRLRPFSLNVNEELWNEAGDGEPLACFKILHELAHILLHRNPISSFSVSESSQVNFAEDEETAEWQAHIFAALTMAPPYLASNCCDSKSLYERFNFPAEFAPFWLEWRRRRPLVVVSDFCCCCGNQSLVRIGNRSKCLHCSHVTPIR